MEEQAELGRRLAKLEESARRQLDRTMRMEEHLASLVEVASSMASDLAAGRECTGRLARGMEEMYEKITGYAAGPEKVVDLESERMRRERDDG